MTQIKIGILAALLFQLASAAEPTPPAATDHLTRGYVDAPMGHVIHTLSRDTGLPLLLDERVVDLPVTINFENEEIQAGLQRLTRAYGLVLIPAGEGYRIRQPDAIAQPDQPSEPSEPEPAEPELLEPEPPAPEPTEPKAPIQTQPVRKNYALPELDVVYRPTKSALRRAGNAGHGGVQEDRLPKVAEPTEAEIVDAAQTVVTPQLSLQFRDAPVREILRIVANNAQRNLVLAEAVDGAITVDLSGISFAEAMAAIAAAADLAIEDHGTFLKVHPATDGRKRSQLSDGTTLRTFKIQYSELKNIVEMVTPQLSRRGQVTVMEERNMLVVRDEPSYLEAIDGLVRALDHAPRQILIEAQILEVSLTESENYGIDWSAAGQGGDIAASGLGGTGTTGLVLHLLSGELNVAINALKSSGRVKTLSNPRLLVLEDQSAKVIVGDRIGYRVSSTTNSVTSESIAFLESGVILNVTAGVDQDRRILLKVDPEVSSGALQDGLPQQNTTSVSTQLIAESGQAILIGGLIRQSDSRSDRGVPVLPLLFGQHNENHTNTETVVIIRPKLIERDTYAEQASSAGFFPVTSAVERINEAG